MSMELCQRALFKPSFGDASGQYASLVMMVERDDGLWLDFNDFTFKASSTGGILLTQALSKNADTGTWGWTTGWVIPTAVAIYKVYFKDGDGYTYDGPILQVGNRILATVVADAANTASYFKTDLPTTVDPDHYKDGFASVRDSNLPGQTKQVLNYDKVGQFLTCYAFTQTPANGAIIEIVNS